MSLRHALLVLLESQPGSGYDLRRRFDSGIGNFWHATHQQVYQELKGLHADKLVEFEVESPGDRPDSKVYHLTRAGRSALRTWLHAAAPAPRLKQSLLVKLFAAHLSDPQELLAELERHERNHRENLEQYRAAEARWFAQDEPARRRHLGPYLTLRCGIRYARDWIESLEEARMLLATGALPQAPVGAGRTPSKPRRGSKLMKL